MSEMKLIFYKVSSVAFKECADTLTHTHMLTPHNEKPLLGHDWSRGTYIKSGRRGNITSASNTLADMSCILRQLLRYLELISI